MEGVLGLGGFLVVDAGFWELRCLGFCGFFLGNSLRNMWYEGISYTCPISEKGKKLSIIFAFGFSRGTL